MAQAELKEAEKKFYVFYSRLPNSSVIFADGSIAVFVGGKLVLEDEGKAAVLLQEIKRGSNTIYIDPIKFEVTEAELDPQAEYKAKIIAEYEAEKAAKELKDAGTSSQGKLNTLTTAGVSTGAVNSVSGTQGLQLRPEPSAPAAPSLASITG